MGLIDSDRMREHTGGGAKALLVAASGLYATGLYVFTWSWEVGGSPDTRIYLLMADYLASLPTGEIGASAQRGMEVAMFPPLHPLLLALLGGSSGIAWTHALTATCLLGALWALFQWQRESLGFWPAAGLTATFALSPSTLMIALESLSENLYLWLSLLYLAALERSGVETDPDPRRRALRTASIMLALALLTRSAAVALLVSGGLILWRREGRRAWRLAVVAVAPLLAWLVLKSLAGFGQTYEDAYSSRLAAFSTSGLAAVWLAGVAQLQALATAWETTFSLHPGLPQRIGAWIVGGLSLLGFAPRLRARDPSAVYVVTYLGMIVAWPFPAHASRFLYVITPLLLVFALEGAALVGRRLAGWEAGRVRAVAAVLIGVLVLPGCSFVATRFVESRDRTYEAFTHTPRWYTRRSLKQAELDAWFRQAIVEAMQTLPAWVEPGACVFATDPMELTLRSGRVGLYPPPGRVAQSTFDDYLSRCDFVFVSARVFFPYDEPFYPLNRLSGVFQEVGSRRAQGLPGRPIVARLVRRTGDADVTRADSLAVDRDPPR
ncbi:hypothetical protein MK489_11825 [Myxococcota bacterium]|nr:hypothetical protein [Myxococcota bacterium]